MIPRILLVEDDPVSRAFLQAALEALPAMVAFASSQAEALAAAPTDLYLIDANLPDGNGAQLLAELRRRQGDIRALAHTADSSADTSTALLAAGFLDVLVKPLGAAELQAAVRKALGEKTRTPIQPATIPGFDAPLWDDAVALRALGGKADVMQGLRGLFLKDLPEQLGLLETAARNADDMTLHHQLHRLKASCGFVGALRLQAIAAALDRALPDLSLFAAFAETARSTLGSAPTA